MMLARLLLLLLNCRLCAGGFVGVNYGTLFSAAPSPQQVVSLLVRQSITDVRLYDSNASMLHALAHTGIQVMVTVPNTELQNVGLSKSSAANWIRSNVLPFLPATNVTAICVGTNVFTSFPTAAPLLIPAMKSLHSVLRATNLSSQIKLSTSCDASLILDSFPPSQAFFNASWNAVLLPLLKFLSSTGSFFMITVYSYDIYQASNGILSIDYALMNPVTPAEVVTDSNTLYEYHNLFDAVLDSAFFALEALNYSHLPVTVSESGWPSATDDPANTDASPDNASTYVSNLIVHVLSNTGTPKRPNASSIDVYIFELFDEDMLVGPSSRRHYGLFNASTLAPVYLLKLSDSRSLLANDTNSTLFCVARSGADKYALQTALDWACGIGRANCSAIQPGQLCYEPNTVQFHASYAFDDYYQAHNRSYESCDFNGVASVSTMDPSAGVCVFPGSKANVAVNGSFGNTTNNSTAGKTTSANNSASMIAAFSYRLHFSIVHTLAMHRVQILSAVALLLFVIQI